VVATETEDLVIGSALVFGGAVAAIAAVLAGAHWWFVLPGLVIAVAVKFYGWSRPLDEAKLAAAAETIERPRIGAAGVLLRALPFLIVWFGLDMLVLLDNPDVAGAGGGGVSIGIGLSFLLAARSLARYGQRHAVVIVSNAPRLYGVWHRSGNLLRARRVT
jgi:hypothetical protein